MAFKSLLETLFQDNIGILRQKQNMQIVKNEHTVSLPLRVNFGGGWSDTPPYCNENGGTVLNAAILLNDQKPVSVTLKKLNEPKIVFDSRDMDVHEEFTSLEKLQSVGDPYDPFVLQKAALLACGIIPKQGGNLKSILEKLGGGFYIDTEVFNVPKGSGLGTSSILAAACAKCLFEFMSIKYKTGELYGIVLLMEQLMSTGGGWQDQIGGASEGIKLISSKPGIKQDINVEKIELKDESVKHLLDSKHQKKIGAIQLKTDVLRSLNLHQRN